MIKRYLDCNRNGTKTNQSLDSRACLACTCQLKVRNRCKDFKEMTKSQVKDDVRWLRANGYAPHVFAARIKGLKGGVDVKMQSMRQKHDRPRDESKAETATLGVRGAVLTV